MPEYFNFNVRLLDVEPPIWRRFLLRKTTTFRDLHDAIQDACGWGSCHLFAFRETEKGSVIAGIPYEDSLDPDPDAQKVKLSSFFPGERRCSYQYDFGDDWWHEVTLEGMPVLKDRFFRRLLGGERTFPPEDCGGIPGYEDCLALVTGKTLRYRRAEELREWLGDWDPEGFNLDVARRAFDRASKPRGRASWGLG